MNRIALILATLALACTAAPPEVGASTEPLAGDRVTGLVGPSLGNNGTVARLEDGATAVYLGQVWEVLDDGDQVDVQWKTASPSTNPPPRAELAIAAGLPPLGEGKLTPIGAVDVAGLIATSVNVRVVVAVPIDSRVQLEPGAALWAVFVSWRPPGVTVWPTYYTTNPDTVATGLVQVYRAPGWWPSEHIGQGQAFETDIGRRPPVLVARAWSRP